jgi:hypothetical protein
LLILASLFAGRTLAETAATLSHRPRPKWHRCLHSTIARPMSHIDGAIEVNVRRIPLVGFAPEFYSFCDRPK